MPPRISWSSLLPGLIASAVVVVTAVGVLLFAGVGKVRGTTVRLYVLTDQARGVMKGTDVWISGQKVGVVDAVDFRAPTDDSLGKVVIAVSVREKAALQIRRDSRAQVRAGANIIGPIVVYISSGTPSSPLIREGDTIQARKQSDFEVAGAKAEAATANLGPIMADARTIVANVRNPDGTVGAMLTERGGSDVARLRAQVTRLRARLSGNGQSGRGGVAGVMSRARMALARTDSIRALLASSNSSYGRFRRDSTLGTTVSGLRDELAELQTMLANTDGTLGRVKTDSALTRSVADARREMSLLFADFRRRPMRYIAF